jgi:hypothetical protein
MGDTKDTTQSEEVNQLIIVKDKQIDLLSSMLAQKEVEIKDSKLQLETQVTSLKQQALKETS